MAKTVYSVSYVLQVYLKGASCWVDIELLGVCTVLRAQQCVSSLHLQYNPEKWCSAESVSVLCDQFRSMWKWIRLLTGLFGAQRSNPQNSVAFIGKCTSLTSQRQKLLMWADEDTTVDVFSVPVSQMNVTPL